MPLIAAIGFGMPVDELTLTLLLAIIPGLAKDPLVPLPDPRGSEFVLDPMGGGDGLGSNFNEPGICFGLGTPTASFALPLTPTATFEALVAFEGFFNVPPPPPPRSLLPLPMLSRDKLEVLGD